LSDNNSPVWLGLPAKAETERMKLMGVKVLSHLNQLLSVSADTEIDAGTQSSSAASKSASTAAALEAATRYQKALPGLAEVANVDEKYTSDSKLTPIQR
jgi:hypothetical protein